MTTFRLPNRAQLWSKKVQRPGKIFAIRLPKCTWLSVRNNLLDHIQNKISFWSQIESNFLIYVKIVKAPSEDSEEERQKTLAGPWQRRKSESQTKGEKEESRLVRSCTSYHTDRERGERERESGGEKGETDANNDGQANYQCSHTTLGHIGKPCMLSKGSIDIHGRL